MKRKNRLKYRILPALLFFFFSEAGAQFDTSFVKSQLLRCADSLAIGFKTRNWEVFARYSNPSIIGVMGGKAAFINFAAGVFGQIPDSAWKVYEPGNILQVIRTGPDFQAVIELRSVIEWEGRKISAVNYLIGQSWDGGSFWTFFDSQNSPKAAKEIKPDLSDELFIPAKNEKAEPLRPPSPLRPEMMPVKTKGKSGLPY
ncbi:MAG: hypothetical protein HYZ15_06855 [Sphingobacteriales bacterium]|nr:hypothetical protein [Sphingobacteriales bacterium]